MFRCTRYAMVGLFLTGAAVGCRPVGDEPQNVSRLEVTTRIEQVGGDSRFQIVYDPAAGGHSKLEYLDSESTLFRVGVEGQPFEGARWFRLGGDIALDIGSDDGIQKDWDWDRAQGVYSLSDADVTPELFSWDANAYFRFYEFAWTDSSGRQAENTRPGYVDAVLGYTRWKERYETGTVLTQLIPATGDTDILSQSYTFDWRAIRLGMRAEAPVGRWCSLRGSVAALRTEFEGHGWWVNRVPTISYDQRAEGWGWEGEFAAGLNFTPRSTLETGLRYLDLRAEDGVADYHYGNGVNITIDALEWAETERVAWFLSYTYRF